MVNGYPEGNVKHAGSSADALGTYFPRHRLGLGMEVSVIGPGKRNKAFKAPPLGVPSRTPGSFCFLLDFVLSGWIRIFIPALLITSIPARLPLPSSPADEPFDDRESDPWAGTMHGCDRTSGRECPPWARAAG